MNELAAPAPAPQPASLPIRRRQRAGLEGLLIIAWLLAVGGAAVGVVGIFLAGLAQSANFESSLDVRLAGPIAIVGGVMLLAGLVVASYRSVVLRRELGEDRYRGPSILILLGIVFVIAGMASVPFIDDFQAAIEGGGAAEASEIETLLLLLSTSLTFFAVALVFVMIPKALPGVRWLPNPFRKVWRPFLLGVLIGGPAWIGATIISVLVTALLGAVFDIHPNVDLVQELVPSLSPLTAILVVVIAAPISEEIFFRGIVFNAWLREYGYWRAFIGSAVLFALIHMSIFSFVPILLLALVLGYVYHQTRSLVTVIAIHATFNAISTALLFTVPNF